MTNKELLLQPFSKKNSKYDYFCLINNKKVLSPNEFKHTLFKYDLGPKIECKRILHHYITYDNTRKLSLPTDLSNFHNFYNAGFALGQKLANKNSVDKVVLLIDQNQDGETEILKYFPKYAYVTIIGFIDGFRENGMSIWTIEKIWILQPQNLTNEEIQKANWVFQLAQLYDQEKMMEIIELLQNTIAKLKDFKIESFSGDFSIMKISYKFKIDYTHHGISRKGDAQTQSVLVNEKLATTKFYLKPIENYRESLINL